MGVHPRLEIRHTNLRLVNLAAGGRPRALLECALLRQEGSDQVNLVWYSNRMDQAVTVTEAKTQLSRLIERAQAGEEIVIRRGRRPVAKLIRYDAAPTPRRLGALSGQIWIAEDFDEPDEEIERLFGTRD